LESNPNERRNVICINVRNRMWENPFMLTYFIKDAVTGYIKIGITADHIDRRLKAITGTIVPRSFRCMGFIVGNVERRLHSHFASDRVKGEWFKELQDCITENALPRWRYADISASLCEGCRRDEHIDGERCQHCKDVHENEERRSKERDALYKAEQAQKCALQEYMAGQKTRDARFVERCKCGGARMLRLSSDKDFTLTIVCESGSMSSWHSGYGGKPKTEKICWKDPRLPDFRKRFLESLKQAWSMDSRLPARAYPVAQDNHSPKPDSEKYSTVEVDGERVTLDRTTGMEVEQAA
jgi:hypothetical protein